MRVLDLACGKGAVSVKLAQKLGVRVKGLDLTPAFVEYARQKAEEFGVQELLEFAVEDVNAAVREERGYDCVIFGSASNVLGSPGETLAKLRETIRPGGYILIDESYLPDEEGQKEIKYKNCDYLTEGQWATLFREAGLELVEAVSL